MNEELENKIKSSLVNGKLLCPVAFQISKELDVNLKVIGETANNLGIKISGCQLGCFP